MRVGIGILPEDRWRDAERKWRAAEDLGFDHAWTADHLGWRSLVGSPWFSAVPTLTAAAAATERIRLGVLVASPNFRHPVPFARELIALDDVADGRVLLGIGAAPGDVYDTHVFGAPELTPGQRAKRYHEFVELLDGLLVHDDFSWSGEFYTARGARNLPGCVSSPRIPFVLAANGPRTMRTAVRYGSGWVTNGPFVDDMATWWRSVAEKADQFGEVLAALGRGHMDRYLSFAISPDYVLTSASAFHDCIGRAQELGFTDVIGYWPRASDPYAGDESVLETVAADVLPAFR
jgi:alkanesulfonate monooxygenase SsuD/methylene tetrahydromethanopterin reductase-like flavin-dependent oxidoreductase (luciferase family)